MATETAAMQIDGGLEAAALERALAGDGQAFARLVGPHLPMLYRLCYRYLRNAAGAEDAVQETLIVAYRALGRYRAGTSFRAFLAATAAGRAQTIMRGEKRRQLREAGSTPPQTIENGEQALGKAQVRENIHQALLGLPEKRRKVAILRLEGELSYAEIAQALDTSERSARVLVHLALRELKQKLGGSSNV